MSILELVWTISPALVLIAIAFPSFRLLYIMDEVLSPTLTIKVVGHQWYWSYEYSDFITESGDAIDFDSCNTFWENVFFLLFFSILIWEGKS